MRYEIIILCARVGVPEMIHHVQMMEEVVSFLVGLLVTMCVPSARTCTNKGLPS